MAPPEPRHIVAQQLLALCLQEHRIGSRLWIEAWNGLAPFDRSAEPILRYLVDQGFIDQDGELLFIGPAAEQRFGHRHFMGMTAVFTAPPQFTVLAGRQEIGRTDPMLLTEKIDGPAAAAARRAQLEGDLDRLEAPPLLRRARRGRRQGPLAHPWRIGGQLRAVARGPGGAARRGPAGGADPAGQADPGRGPRRAPVRRAPGRHGHYPRWRGRPLVDLGGLPRQRHPRRDLVPPDRQRPALRRRQPPAAR